ncbi:protein of unknown function (DUF1520) [Thioflavicoccus mobilis 8321]|uniref:Uncharacterized protein n=2 Tax=Thioflavicoccus mobilis TaxID=80679 RepID=L0H3A3_9GAMM|nr:protein of unknown function (DUF1520) [Thioflavicoccus mobilis 8321]
MMGGPAGMPGGYGGPGRMMGGADPAATTQRLNALKQQLGITLAQESAWDDYAAAVTTRAALMNGHRQAMLDGGVSPVQMQQFRQSGFAQMQQMATASRRVQTVLTPAQRTRAGGLMGGWGQRW